MAGFVTNLEDATLKNTNFRQVLYTAPHSQLVVMSIGVGEDIGLEVHSDVDQFIRVESGAGQAILDGLTFPLVDGSAIVVPAGTQHQYQCRLPSKTLYRLYPAPAP